ncbi:outer membrane protein [Bradyrhizobium centrolobii]|uniref:outer membrane protein n=1 Tax=Bradyrhizobium centrolobii TaxID=1505087 RepID=UPI0009ED0AEC|nr:outer membrane beta-barrel protein [Bradyrhizobium centrolobii]
MRSELRFWTAATAALVASGAANSADLAPATKVPPALWSWTGGYVGGHVGGGYGRTSFSDPYGPSLYGDVVDTPVFVAGGQIGYNWQRDRWVLGLELDASGTVSDGTGTCLAVSGVVVNANCKAGPDVFVSGIGRLGYAFGPQGHTLAYLKAGVAWQHNRGDVVNNNEFFGQAPQGATHFDYGRVGGTIGAGIEQALTPAWSITLEYDYLRFGGPSVRTPPTLQVPPVATIPANVTSLSSSYHIGKLGLNYHLDDPNAPRSEASFYATKPTRRAPPIAFTEGWSLESGTRLWLSRGRFQWDHSPNVQDPTELVSRLIYHKLDGISGELFERVDSPWGIFLKGNIGFGRFNSGAINNEDWGLGPPVWMGDRIAYTNFLSGQANGRFTYYTADAGYDFLRSSTYKIGGFIGWSHYGQTSDSTGLVQIASAYLPSRVTSDRVIGSQDTDWNALRIGVSAETILLDRWRVSADVAYIPWTNFQGRDYHLLRDETMFTDQRGSGGAGVQIEGVLSYFLTNNFSIGVGGRYWSMWTSRFGRESVNSIANGDMRAKFSMERWGTFFQASYKLE